MTDQELTRLAAERVMGWEIRYNEDRNGDMDFYEIRVNGVHKTNLHLWNPLTDWRVAGEIVERMRELGWLFDLGVGKYASASFYKQDGVLMSYRHSNSVPRAITMAALKCDGVGMLTDAGRIGGYDTADQGWVQVDGWHPHMNRYWVGKRARLEMMPGKFVYWWEVRRNGHVVSRWHFWRWAIDEAFRLVALDAVADQSRIK